MRGQARSRCGDSRGTHVLSPDEMQAEVLALDLRYLDVPIILLVQKLQRRALPPSGVLPCGGWGSGAQRQSFSLVWGLPVSEVNYHHHHPTGALTHARAQTHTGVREVKQGTRFFLWRRRASLGQNRPHNLTRTKRTPTHQNFWAGT